jgi:hypothetical protein
VQVEFAQDFTVTYRGTFKVRGAYSGEVCQQLLSHVTGHASQLLRWLLVADLRGQAVLVLSSVNMPA